MAANRSWCVDETRKNPQTNNLRRRRTVRFQVLTTTVHESVTARSQSQSRRRHQLLSRGIRRQRSLQVFVFPPKHPAPLKILHAAMVSTVQPTHLEAAFVVCRMVRPVLKIRTFRTVAAQDVCVLALITKGRQCAGESGLT